MVLPYVYNKPPLVVSPVVTHNALISVPGLFVPSRMEHYGASSNDGTLSASFPTRVRDYFKPISWVEGSDARLQEFNKVYHIIGTEIKWGFKMFEAVSN